LSTLCGGEILFIIFSPAGKPYSFGHPFVESVAKHFSNASQHLEETIDALVESCFCHWWKAPIDHLNLRELYEQDDRFVEFNNLISITRDKKIAAISSIQAPMDDDVPLPFTLDMALISNSFACQYRESSRHTRTCSCRWQTYGLWALLYHSYETEIHHWWKAPIDQLNQRELYEQDEFFAEFNNLISITRDKKIAAISSNGQ
ncbi:hypothetical protein Gotri_005909, partial [Gossypium trilobum]|nr:hypothetical protein [Gossypium trilobum]